VLVTGQVAVSFLLVLLSTLFGVSLLNAQNQDSVLPATALAFADLSPGAFGYDAAHVQLFYGALLERARNRAGVDAAAFARHVPLNSIYGGGATQGVSIPGVEPPKGQSSLAIRQNVVSPGYFATMDIPLVGGRDFNTLDTANGAKVIIINETMARMYWPDAGAVNRAVDLVDGATGAREPATVIGVAHDSKYATLKEATPPYLYLPLSQQRIGEMTLITRGSIDENALAGLTREIVREVDPAMPPVELMTKSQHLRRALFGERMLSGVVTVIGSISLLLAVVALYGVVAFAVARRTRDIGIEMALGATTRRIITATMAVGARLTAIGMLVGGAVGVAVAQMFAGALYGVTALSPRVLGASIVITAIVTTAATFLPARRAGRVDPITALRE
jgi:predicted permease